MPDQVELLAQTFGCVRFVYNSILRWRIDANYERQEKIGHTQASARLTVLKISCLNDVSCVTLQQALRHQPTAFRTSSPGVLNTRHSKESAINRPLN